jgi:hypothetical protein
MKKKIPTKQQPVIADTAILSADDDRQAEREYRKGFLAVGDLIKQNYKTFSHRTFVQNSRGLNIPFALVEKWFGPWCQDQIQLKLIKSIPSMDIDEPRFESNLL